MNRSLCCVLAFVACACSTGAPPAPPPQSPDAPRAAATPPPATRPETAAPAAPPGPADKTCGALGCQLFDDASLAFARVLEQKPLVLGVGEAHAQKGTEGVASTTSRFTQLLLPMVSDRASDIVIELMEPDSRCVKTTEQVREKIDKEVTKDQAKSNKNEFVILGTSAKERGVQPHILYPSCEQYQRIVDAGADYVTVSLETIALLTDQKTKALLQRNHRENRDKMVLLYGGAIHNDIEPRPGRETWSYGPSLSTFTAGRYVELDLIVREYIKDTEAWQALPWYAHFDKGAHADQAVLFNPGPNWFVLIFPAS